jgi:polyhydroxyalkanoate synthase
VAPALTEVMGRLAAQPDRLMRAQADLFSRYMELWQSAPAAGGEETRARGRPGQGRQALQRPDWAKNPSST